jgi:hypothetical protein
MTQATSTSNAVISRPSLALGATVTLAGLVSFNCVNHGLIYFALILRTICQPAATAIAYSLDKKVSDKRNILSFDFVEFFFRD